MSSTIPQTILAQLGGNGFAMLTGSKNFVTSHQGEGLTFQPGTTCKLETLAEHTDVYAEDLLDIFETETDLYATLGKR